MRRPHPSSGFSLVTQNLDAFSPRPAARARLLLSSILDESTRPDILFLQEVTSDVRTAILADPAVREAFLVTDAEDRTSFEGVPFANMTLLSSKRFPSDPEAAGGAQVVLGPVYRVGLPSKYGRCALSVDVLRPMAPPITGTVLRLINVHLDSLWDTFHYRAEQLEILADLLREPGCGGGLIAGDFNAISASDHALLERHGLVDAWVALHGGEGRGGATWGVRAGRDSRPGGGRLDKVALLGVEARGMEILRPPRIEVPKPARASDYIPCSDHHGLRLSFDI